MLSKCFFALTFLFFHFSSADLGPLINATNSSSTTVFQSDHDRRFFYRIPAMAVYDGNPHKIIFVFAEERVRNNNEDSGNINVVYKMSFDHGQNWTRQYLACNYTGTDGVDGTCGNPTVTVDHQGKIHLFMNANNHNKKQGTVEREEDRFRPGDRKILYRRGQYNHNIRKIDWDWSEPRNLSTDLQNRYSENFDLVGPGTGIVYDNPASGRHRRIIVPAASRNFYSDDGGDSWTESRLFARNISSETSIVQLPSNLIYRNDRMHGKYDDGVYCARPEGLAVPEEQDYICRTRRMVSLVESVGTILNNPVVDNRLLDSPAQGSSLRYTKNDIMVANCASKNRKNLTIRYSNGTLSGTNDPTSLNFISSMRIDTDCGYSSMAKTRDYRIGIVYEANAKDPGFGNDLQAHNYPKDLVFKKFPLSQFQP